MRAYMKKTPLTLLFLVGWLFAAPLVSGDDLTAERQEQNAARREQTADPQARKAAQRAERQELKAEERAKRKGLRAEQQAQQAQRQEEKAERQEQKDAARGTIYREARGREASDGLKSVTGGLMYLQMSYTDCVLTLLILIPFRLLCHGESTKQSPASMRHRE